MSRGSRVFGWAFYDLANTVFAMSVLTLYGPLYIEEDLRASQLSIGVANAVAVIALVFALPMLGTIADEFGRRKPFVTWFTLLCVAATAVTANLPTALGVLVASAVARFGYQAALVFYEAMLPDVAESDSKMATVSGIGTGLGYAGSFVAIGIVPLFMGRPAEEHRAEAFLPTAGLFLLCAAPFLLLVGDRAAKPMPWGELFRRSARSATALFTTLKAATKHRAFFLYLVSSFFFLDAVHTAFMFMGVYLKKRYNLSDDQIRAFFVAGILSAGFGSFLIGWFADRAGPGRVLRFVLVAWLATLGAAILASDVRAVWALAVLFGVALGGTWTTCRPALLLLAPKERQTEFYSLYGVVSKASSLAGPLIWGLIVDVAFKDQVRGYSYALGALAGMIVVGLLLIPREALRPPVPAG